ncbi:MAG: TonB-dependent receptor [Terricaulis sp.]
MRAIIAVFAGILAAPGLAAAQSSEEQEIIVTAPLEGSRIESLQGATSLSREDVIANLGGGIGDTLDAQPGVSTTFFGAGASRPIIRGLGEDRVRVLENGIGAIDASTASPDHAVTADGLDAQRIEVLRGAAALAYGGNAVGGVVNIIDESIPTHQPADAFAFDGLAAYSSGDEGRQASGNITADAGAFVLHASAAARDTEDYAIPGFARSAAARAADPLPDETEGEATNSWTSYRAYSAGGSVVQDWGFAGLAVKRTEDEYGLPPEAPGEPGGHIELQQTRVESRGDIAIDVGPFDRLDFGVQHADYEHTEFEGDGAPGTKFTSNGWEGRVEAHHRSGRLQGAIGIQAIDNDFAAEGDEAFITPTNTRDLGLFAVERWDAGAWGLEGGGRFERRQIDNEGGGDLEIETASASAGIFLRPAAHWFVGGTLARTERAPTAIELFADGPHLATANYEVGDPTLSKEVALSTEISLRYSTDALSLEFNLFRVGFDDYVALVERGDVWWLDEGTETSGFAPGETDPSIPADAEVLPVFAFTQQDATFSGGEISASARLFEAAGFTFRGTAALDLVRAEFDAGGHPPRIPPRTATFGLEAANARISGRVEVADVAEQTRVAAFETPTDGYTFVNANLAFRPFDDPGRLTLRLDARNLTDEEGRVHASFLKDELPLPGRSVRLTVATEF